VEDQLCASYDVRKALAKFPVPKRPKVGDITRYLPRTEVVRYWKQALKQSLTALIQADDEANGKAVNLLTCHLDLYGGRRREMYSPTDLRAFAEDGNSVTHVLLLIDDIYDMYMRLSQPAYLYDEGAGLAEYMRQQGVTDTASDPSPAERQQQADLTLEYKTSVLAVLLSWRRAEMLMAESVAHQLEAKYMVYAIKQATAAAGNWLRHPERNAVYISHPITRPRNTRRTTGSWPADRIVQECNELQARLDVLGVTCVMPTGIDELRFAVGSGTQLPRLEMRWPIASGQADFSDTMYTSEFAEQPELANVLLDADLQDDARDWRPWLRSLENQIMTEVAFRDHHLVAASPGLLVLRPFYGTGEASHGVAAEVDHWRSLTADPDPNQRQRRGVFIHFSDDVEAMLRKTTAFETADLEYQVTAAKALILEQRGFSHRGMAKVLIRTLSSGSALDSLLDAGLIPVDLHSRLRSDWPAISQEAQVLVLRELLTLIEMPEDLTGIWVVDSESELQKAYPAIAAFLRGKAKPPVDWIKPALAALARVSSASRASDEKKTTG